MRVSVSWLFVVLFVVAVIVIQTSINHTPINEEQVKIGLVLLMISLIGYLVSRSMQFFQMETEHKKRPSVPRQQVRLVFKDASFDSIYNYRRRIKYLAPQFDKPQLTVFNVVQCLALLVEFLQLLSFPLRDLVGNLSFQEALLNPEFEKTAKLVSGLRQFLSSIATGLPSINTAYLLRLQFAMAWWTSLVSVLLCLVLTVLYYVSKEPFFEKLPQMVQKITKQLTSGSWIMIVLPLINIFYLIILVAFIDPLGCLSSSSTPLFPPASLNDLAQARQDRILQCYNIHDLNPPLFTWYAIIGFILSYFLLTICRYLP